jgi:PAS domain S-box-containing protein
VLALHAVSPRPIPGDVIDRFHQFHQRVRVALIAGYALFALGLVGVTSWLLVTERGAELARARDRSMVIARALEEHVRTSLAAVDTLLRDQVERTEAAGGLARISVATLHQNFQQQVRLVPQLRGMFTFDAGGFLFTTQLNRDVPRIDGREFDFVRAHRQSGDSGLFIGETRVSPVTGLPFIPMTRRIVASGGGFGGVMGAAVNPEYFQRFYQSLALGPGSAIGVLLADGKLLVRAPALPPGSVWDPAVSPLFVDGINRRDSGTLDFRSPRDGAARIASYRKLGSLPIVVVVSFEKDVVLQVWRSELAVKVAMAAAVLLLVGGLLLFTLRTIARRSADAARYEQSRAEATQSLAEAEERYRSLVETSPLGIVIHHLGVIEYANAGAADILGEAAPCDMHGRHLNDYVHPEDQAGVTQRLETLAARSGALPRKTYRAFRRDGRAIVIEARSVSFEQGGRRISQVVLHDITEERQAEAALRSSEARFAKIFAASPVAIVLSELGSGKCIQVNAAFENLSGYSSDEWQGRSAVDFDFWLDRDHAVWRATLAATGRAGPLDLRYRQKNGNEGFAVQESFVIEFDGEMRSLSFIQDITARKRAERSLTESEAKFREVFENASDAMWIVDVAVDGNMTYDDCNHTYANTIGRAVRDVSGRTPHDLFPQVTADRVVAHWRKCVETGQRVELTSREGISHGNRYLAIHLLPLKDAAGRVRKIAGVARDFTEIKRAEDEIRVLNLGLEQKIRRRTADLEAAYKELEAFSYSVSHDLRAPARAVAGFSQIMLDEHAGELSPEVRRLVDRIVAAGARMSELIDGLLVLTHVSRQDLQRRRVDMSALAAAVVHELRELDPSRDVEVTLQPGLVAEADPQLVRSLLQNLLGNAWKYSSRAEHAKIEFSAFNVDGRRVFVVRDNGAGFDMAYAQKLFGVFERLHTDAEFEGTGIGLATADRIVRRHGGSIRAEAQPGKGASFYFTLSA